MIKQTRIGILLYEGCALMDFAGPVSVFHGAGRHFVWTAQSHEPAYDVELLSLEGGTISTWESVAVDTRPVARFDDVCFDTLLVVGGLGDDRDVDPRLIEWLRSTAGRVRRLASVCSGAYLLAAAGYLDGKRASTHWEDCELLARRFPQVRVCNDAIYVNEGPIWTSAGVTSGIDMALAMVEEDHGRAIASLVARRHVVPLRRSSGQSAFASNCQSLAVQGPMASLLNWITHNPCDDLRADLLASRANMSLRNFYRAFRSATGMTPADWVEAMRLEHARKLLAQHEPSIDEVAFKAGFSSYEHLRKVFLRAVGTSPAAYRRDVLSGTPATSNSASTQTEVRTSVPVISVEESVV